VITQVGHGTDTGKKRRRNEDEYVVEPPLFAIADGMGGAQAGELASELAAGAVRDDDVGGVSGERRVAELIQEANRRVYQRSSQDASASGMGTTMTVALVEDVAVAFGHVGDSDTFSVPTKPGDLFMLCSDGLTSMVEDDVILSSVEKNREDLNAAVKALIRAANKGGGEDNITIVLFEIGDGTGEPLEETAQYPVLRAEGNGEVDEDTLDEVDRVPAVETMVVPPEQAGQVIKGAKPKSTLNTLRNRLLAFALIVIALAVIAIVVLTIRGR
jgi:serine/threonine protein phosphatase PrpC